MGEVFKQTFALGFHYLSQEKVSIADAKIFICENIIKNIVNFNKKHPLTKQNLKEIDNFIKEKILPFFKTKYPISKDELVSHRFRDLEKQVNINNKSYCDYIERSQIEFMYRQSGNYNDLIMRTINYILKIVDNPSEYIMSGRSNSNYDDFQNEMREIFSIAEDYDVMILGEKDYTKYVQQLFILLAETGSV